MGLLLSSMLASASESEGRPELHGIDRLGKKEEWRKAAADGPASKVGDDLCSTRPTSIGAVSMENSGETA